MKPFKWLARAVKKDYSLSKYKEVAQYLEGIWRKEFGQTLNRWWLNVRTMQTVENETGILRTQQFMPSTNNKQ